MDKVPVIIGTLIILEVNMDSVISTTTVQGPFEDGDTVEYVSISSYRNLTETYFPFGLQVTMQGMNMAGDAVINTWAIEYTNNCDFEPVFAEDAQIGWTILVSELRQTIFCASCISDFTFNALPSIVSDRIPRLLANLLSSE
jgi:hypothetical protein